MRRKLQLIYFPSVFIGGLAFTALWNYSEERSRRPTEFSVRRMVSRNDFALLFLSVVRMVHRGARIEETSLKAGIASKVASLLL